MAGMAQLWCPSLTQSLAGVALKKCGLWGMQGRIQSVAAGTSVLSCVPCSRTSEQHVFMAATGVVAFLT